MKTFIHATLSLLILLIAGCGDDQLSIIPQPAPHPVITAAHFSQNRLISTIEGSVDFEAPGNDLISMTKTLTDSQGAVVYFDQPTLNLPGVRTGTIPFSVSYAPFPDGTYTLKIQLANTAGGFSNAEIFTFTK